MGHECGRTTIEQQLRELGDHRAADILLRNEWPVHELATFEAVLDDTALLEPRQQRRDGRLRELALGPQAVLHVQHRRLGTIPQDAHDGELQIGERYWHGWEG